MFFGVYCFPHQCHLMTLSLLKVLARWSWEEPERELPVRYFNGVVSIANVWRATGAPAKIVRAAVRLFGDDVAHDCFRKVPGRCLRGRWLSIDSVGSAIVKGLRFMVPVLLAVFGNLQTQQGQGGATASDVPTDGDEAWAEQQSAYKRNTVSLARSSVFKAMVAISEATKAPLVHFHLWAQQEVRAQNKRVAAAKGKGQGDFGPTLLSQLLDFQGDQIRSEMNDFLDADVGEEGPFALLPALLSPSLLPKARQLIVTLVLQALASWDFRITAKTRAFPLRLLTVVAAPAHGPDDRRRDVAGDLLP